MVNYFKKNKSGQSLIEVVVAVGMMALLLTAILALVSLSVKNSRVAKDRAQAVSLAQEGVELMRTYRDYNWTDFSTKANGDTYNLSDTWTVTTGLVKPCNNNNVNVFYTRCVKLESGVMVTVDVSWKEGNQTYQTNQVTQLTLWER